MQNVFDQFRPIHLQLQEEQAAGNFLLLMLMDFTPQSIPGFGGFAYTNE